MTDASGQQISLDANVLEGNSEAFQITYQTEDGQTVTTLASTTGTEGDIVSKAFTTVAEGAEASVEYITMTPEEAAAAGVVTATEEEEEQVVTTSLQFDPANPSVLYTADGTPINQADLTPEEQALVQAALQQHLAEQEAEQQLQMIDDDGQTSGEQAVVQTADGNIVTSSTVQEQNPQATITNQPILLAGSNETAAADTTVTSTGNTVVFQTATGEATSIDLASPDTSASQIVQTLANNVRKQQLEEKLKMSYQKTEAVKPAADDVKYSEKIVIRQGQPQVVKVPLKKPDIPAALANLMPKVEIGKDGSQVIRIHQSQITQGQLQALQENPNVRLVFRPASSKQKPASASRPTLTSSMPKKRGRPRKVPGEEPQEKQEEEPEIEDPPAKTRCGRVSKRSVFMKDYLTPKVTKELDDEDDVPDDRDFTTPTTTPYGDKRPRGRPPGSGKGFKPRGSYATKIEALQNRDLDPIPIQMKPALTPIEQALSTRRKNRLREMLGACSEDEIMEVAMPHLARVFSLWEFLVTKVEKNKMSRVFFADIYKEYECLHKYVSKLAEKYKQAIEEKATPETTEAAPEKNDAAENEKKEDETEESIEKEEAEKTKEVPVTFAKLAESLGLEGSTLKEAEISLLDPEEAIGPYMMGMFSSPPRRGQSQKNFEDKTTRKHGIATSEVRTEAKSWNANEGAKPIQTEATSTISSSATSTQNASMPALKPLGQAQQTTSETQPAVNGAADGSTSQAQTAETPMETDSAAAATADTATTEASASTGTQLIQIGQGDDQQFIEVPEGYTLIQTPEGLVMSQPGTTISQGEDGTIYITHADGTVTPLNAATQQGVPMETVESLLSLDGQQQQT